MRKSGEGLLWLKRTFTFMPFLLIPFLGGNDLPLSFVTIDKFWIETSFVLLLIFALFTHYLVGGGPGRGFGHFLVAASPLAVICICSLLYTWNRMATFNEINVLVWSFGAVLLYYSAEDRDRIHQALIIGSLLAVLSAVIQLGILFPWLASTFTSGKYAQMVRDQVAPFGSFLNQNMFGSYFLYTLPLAIYCMAVKRRAAYLLAVSVLILGMLLSLSRLTMVIGCVSVLSVCLILWGIDRKMILKVGLSFGCALIVFLVLLHSERRNETSTMKYLIGNKIERVSTELSTLDKRTGIWSVSYRAFAEKPVIGYGAGAFEYAYRRFYDGGLYTKYAHGSLAKTVVELGSLGLLSFLFYLLAFARGVAGRIRQTSSGCIAISALSGILCSFVDFTLDIPAHVVTFFVLTSAFVGPQQGSVRMVAKKPLLLCFTILLCLSFLFTARTDLSRKVIEEGILAEEVGLFGDAYRSYVDATSTMPISNEGYIRTISILLKSFDNEKDPQYRERVKQTLNFHLQKVEQSSDKDSELFFVRGMARSVLAPGKEACALGTAAISLYPSSAHYIFETARCYAALGDFDEALRVISRVEPYLHAFSASGNPQGLFVYKIKDLEADIEYKKGNTNKAIAIENANLIDGMAGKYAIYNIKARELWSKELLIDYLSEKVQFYEEGGNK